MAFQSPYSRNPTTGPNLQPNKSSTHPTVLGTILVSVQSMPRSPKFP